jgi:hypothetical protein
MKLHKMAVEAIAQIQQFDYENGHPPFDRSGRNKKLVFMVFSALFFRYRHTLKNILTGIQLWAHICAHLNFELRDCLTTFPIFVPSQRLIARIVRELFSFNRGVSHLNEACRIDDLSRGSLLCYEILANN